MGTTKGTSEGELGVVWRTKRRTLWGKYISMARMPTSLGRVSEGWTDVPLVWTPLTAGILAESEGVAGRRGWVGGGWGEGEGGKLVTRFYSHSRPGSHFPDRTTQKRATDQPDTRAVLKLSNCLSYFFVVHGGTRN